jgi:beta-galactosidase
MKHLVNLFVILTAYGYAMATPIDTTYTIDLSKNNVRIISGHLKLGTNRNARGEVLDANSLYFIRNGKPWFPVMGEFHFSRYPKAQWEESILKMKAAGIDVIATYVFWIYHEEEEGVWDWEGNRDLKQFASLCAKHNIYLFPRIGPWCHGEVRNGGLPDWVLQKAKTRRNDSTYLAYVQKFYTQIDKQLKGFYFKEGGPIIGTQIENEFRFNNPSGLAHMLTLKKLAIDSGIDVPYYTATGWPGSDIRQTELIPVWGGYPEAPWDNRTTKLPLSENYVFGPLRKDATIGNDILDYSAADTTNFSGYRYPYATAEMGGGNQVTYHRRPIIEADDVTALAYVKTGSGANLMGYYMFHGGSNAIGKLSTLQESKATKYPNDYGIINYDFYAPIGEWGQLRPSYHGFKAFHLFLNDFGDRLAPTTAFFPYSKGISPGNTDTLRWSVRSDGKSGFVFISNFQRQLPMKDHENVQFSIRLDDGSTMHFPDKGINISKGMQMIMPFNQDMSGALLKYATAQPLCILQVSEPVYVFFAQDGIVPEYVFEKKGIQSITGGKRGDRDSLYKITIAQPGTSALIEIVLADGKRVRILTLTKAQALSAWKANVWGKERLFISDNDMIFTKDDLRLQSTGNASFRFSVYPAEQGIKTAMGVIRKTADGTFTRYALTLPEKKLKLVWHEDERLHADPSLVQRQLVNDSVISMPVYGPFLSAINGARYWKAYVPKAAMSGLFDAFLKIDYAGDTFAAYLNGKLIADDFYAGLPMMIGLKRFTPEVLEKEIVLLVTPLTDDRNIYFEEGIREPLKERIVAEIKNISILPQYEVRVKM